VREDGQWLPSIQQEILEAKGKRSDEAATSRKVKSLSPGSFPQIYRETLLVKTKLMYCNKHPTQNQALLAFWRVFLQRQ
jgi:hypothetical protein